jgi:PIN domain nuclease of toxin-antitoxin system
MNLLLDTCVLVWLSSEPEHISAKAVLHIDDSENNLFISDATVLEISLKHAIGKLSLPESPENWFNSQMATWGATSLPITRSDIYESAKLPWLHKDPFDRLLIATAKNHALTMITPDRIFENYSVPVVWA